MCQAVPLQSDGAPINLRSITDLLKWMPWDAPLLHDIPPLPTDPFTGHTPPPKSMTALPPTMNPPSSAESNLINYNLGPLTSILATSNYARHFHHQGRCLC